MNPTEISGYISFIVDQIKSTITYRGIDPKKKRPKFNPIYGKTVELKERIEIHTELDKKPLEMMEKRAPYEDDRQYKYRKENWNSVTMPYFAKALGKLNRIMNPSNYSISWGADRNDHKDYFENQIPISRSIETYFEQIVMVKKILDPNALLVVKPFYLPTREVEEDGKIVLETDQSKEMPVVPVMVDCERVLEYREGEFAIIELLEKSKVQSGSKEVKEGYIFEIYDRNTIWRVKQIGKKSDWIFSEPEIYYQHNIGYLPCEKLKGYPKQDDLHIYYQSYFIDAIPNLDVALYLNSNLDMSLVTHMHPQRVEQTDRCDNLECMGRGYIIEFANEQELRKPCGRCNGTGSLSKTGPMMVKQVTMPDNLNMGESSNSFSPPGIWYVAPSAEPLEFIDKKIDHLINAAFMFINIDVSNSEVKGSETALGKQIDREELFSFMMRISNELFDLLEFTIKTMGEMRYGKSFVMPEVNAPVSFQVRSEKDLTEELGEAKKAGLPEIALREIITQTMSKRFSSQVLVEKSTNLIMAVDRLVTMSNIESQAQVASGLAAKWEAILHASAGAFVEQLAIENPKFFELDFNGQRDALIEKAKSVESSLTTQKGSAGNVLDIANA